MQHRFSIFGIAAAILLTATVISCNKEKNAPEAVPTVTLEQRSTTLNSFTFNLKAENATEAAYIVLDSEAEGMSAEKIFSEGVKVEIKDAGTFQDDYEIKDLKDDTGYKIAAAAKSKNGKYSEVAELPFRTSVDENKITFDIEVKGSNHASIKILITPSNETASYAALVYKSELTKELSDEDLYTYIIDDYKKIAEQQGVDLEAILLQILHMGTVDGAFNGLEAETEYEIIAVAMDETGTRNSDLYREIASTTEFQMSDITFDIKVPEEEITATTIHVTITPSNLDEKFVWLCQGTDTYPGCSARDIAEDYVKKFGNMLNVGMGLYSGVQDYANYEVMSGKEYFIVVFAYSNGITSEPQMVTFTTKDGSDPETFDCTFNLKEVEAHKAKIDVTPNDNSIFYVCGASETEGFDIAQIKSDIEAQILDYYNFQHNFNPTYSMAMAVQENSARGILTDRIVEPLKDKTSYTLFAFGMTLDGKATEKYVTSEPFTTPEFIISDAAVTNKYFKHFDGDAAYEEGLFDGADSRGKSIIAVGLDGNDKVSEAYHGILYGDFSDTQAHTDESLWSAVNWQSVKDIASDPYVFYLSEWDTQITVFSAAKDAEGNWGPVSRIVLTPSKDEISPIGELIEILPDEDKPSAIVLAR